MSVAFGDLPEEIVRAVLARCARTDHAAYRAFARVDRATRRIAGEIDAGLPWFDRAVGAPPPRVRRTRFGFEFGRADGGPGALERARPGAGFSPDGRWFAFEAATKGGSERIVAVDGSGNVYETGGSKYAPWGLARGITDGGIVYETGSRTALVSIWDAAAGGPRVDAARPRRHACALAVSNGLACVELDEAGVCSRAVVASLRRGEALAAREAFELPPDFRGTEADTLEVELFSDPTERYLVALRTAIRGRAFAHLLCILDRRGARPPRVVAVGTEPTDSDRGFWHRTVVAAERGVYVQRPAGSDATFVPYGGEPARAEETGPIREHVGRGDSRGHDVVFDRGYSLLASRRLSDGTRRSAYSHRGFEYGSGRHALVFVDGDPPGRNWRPIPSPLA